MIYLDNASTTIQKPQAVIDAVASALTDYGNPSRSAHSASLAANRMIYRCREQVATLWDEVTRFENPHHYYVDLSQNLWEVKNRLLQENAR